MKSGGISLFGENDICDTDWKDQMWTEAQMSYGPQQGWQCPLCGTVYAPFITCCTCGNSKRHTITTTASTAPSGKDPRGDKK